MEEKELLQQIAVLAQKRYNGLNEIENVTNQLQDERVNRKLAGDKSYYNQ